MRLMFSNDFSQQVKAAFKEQLKVSYTYNRVVSVIITYLVNLAAIARSKRNAQEDLSTLLREWKVAKSQMEAAIKKVDIPEIVSPNENFKNFEGLDSLYKEDIPIELWAAFLIASIFLILLGLMCYKCKQNSRI